MCWVASLWLDMCACVHTQKHAHTHTHVRTHTCTHTHTATHACAYIHVHAYTNPKTHHITHSKHAHTHTHTHTHRHTHTHTPTHTHTIQYTYTCTYMYIIIVVSCCLVPHIHTQLNATGVVTCLHHAHMYRHMTRGMASLHCGSSCRPLVVCMCSYFHRLQTPVAVAVALSSCGCHCLGLSAVDMAHSRHGSQWMWL